MPHPCVHHWNVTTLQSDTQYTIRVATTCSLSTSTRWWCKFRLSDALCCRFRADRDAAMKWNFRPMQSEIKVCNCVQGRVVCAFTPGMGIVRILLILWANLLHFVSTPFHEVNDHFFAFLTCCVSFILAWRKVALPLYPLQLVWQELIRDDAKLDYSLNYALQNEKPFWMTCSYTTSTDVCMSSVSPPYCV